MPEGAMHGSLFFENRRSQVPCATTGMMKLGDTVTWEAVHFGIKQRLV
jgi:hypothetical protein